MAIADHFSSSDVAMFSVIYALRDAPLNISESLAMGTFIADKILTDYRCKQHRDVDGFVLELKLFLLPSSFLYFYDAIQSFHFELFDSVNNIFSLEELSSPNRALTPSMIKRDSLVGTYVRALHTRWIALPFSSTGEVFEKFSKFCLNQSPVCLHLPKETCSSISLKSSDYIKAAERALGDNDTFSALSNIHRFFDNLDSKRVDIYDRPATSPSHVIHQQEAMLSLATMWIKNEEISQAIIATEEGMRMSHQLGDHTSVARALLLLHHVVDRSPEKAEDSSLLRAPSSESVLIRCIHRCTELSLRKLEVQSILLLIRLRSKGPLHNLKSKRLLGGGIASIEEEHFQYRYTSKTYSKLLHSSHCSRIFPFTLWTLLSSALLMESLYSVTRLADESSCRYNGCDYGRKKEDPNHDILSMMELMGHAGLVSGELWDRLGVLSMTEFSCKRALRQAIFLPSELFVYLCGAISAARSKCQANGSVITLSHILLFIVTKNEYDIAKYHALQRCMQAERLLALTSKNILILDCGNSLSLSRFIDTSLSLIRMRKQLYFSETYSETNLKEILQICPVSAHIQSESIRVGRPFFYFEAAILRCFILSFFSKKLMLRCLVTFESEITENSVLIGEVKILKSVGSLLFDPRNISEALCSIYDACEHTAKEYAPLCDASLSALLLSGLLISMVSTPKQLKI